MTIVNRGIDIGPANYPAMAASVRVRAELRPVAVVSQTKFTALGTNLDPDVLYAVLSDADYTAWTTALIHKRSAL